MGELHRRLMQERIAALKGREPATEDQLNYLRALCLEVDEEVDEKWLAGLSKPEASAEISRRTGTSA